MRNLLTTFVDPPPPGQNSNSSDRTKTSGDLLTDTRFDLSPQYHDPKLELEWETRPRTELNKQHDYMVNTLWNGNFLVLVSKLDLVC